MKKKRIQDQPVENRTESPSSLRTLRPALLVFTLVIALGLVVFPALRRPADSSPSAGQSSAAATRRQPDYTPMPQGRITFCREIAPIIWKNCVPCHRSGQAAPFPLMTYGEVKKRARQIAEITLSRQMPPWLPESGFGRFQAERRLTDQELGQLQQWITEGAAEGNPGDLPAPPVYSDGWALGKPDLVVSMDRPFHVPAEGRDIYRNFVVPIPTSTRRHIRAVEFMPGNPGVVHHAFLFLDTLHRCRKLSASESEPGFAGMRLPDGVRMPEGQFLSYQPGKLPSASPEGMGWTLEPGTDLVLQTHLNPDGKTELLSCSVGFYFSQVAPSDVPFKMTLASLMIDIPPGKSDYVVEDQFTFPVGASLLGILPHAHYLAKEMKADATLPDGSHVPLLWIRDWDFRWQGDYRYEKPIKLPQGTVVSMRYVYDNSASNPRNPNHPPVRVNYGPQSSDEMGELWLQLALEKSGDRTTMARVCDARMEAVLFERADFEIRINPKDARAHLTKAKVLFRSGKLPEARAEFELAVTHDPDSVGTRFDFGLFLLECSEPAMARVQFEAMKRLDPSDYRAHGGLGTALMNQGYLVEASASFEQALRLNPSDPVASESIELIKSTLSKKRAR